MLTIPLSVKEFIKNALIEDIGHGDITSSLIVDDTMVSEAQFIAKEDVILAGVPFVKEVFHMVDPDIKIEAVKNEGDGLKNGDVIALVSGKTISLLAGERVSLNILQRLSGIATLTHTFVEKVKGLPVKIVDTRKTTPNMRFMEKYAVRVGGGDNHRFGLFDGILIKDNHIKAAGGIREALKRARGGHHLLKIEIEVKNMDELREAIEEGVDRIMLDNMSMDEMKKAVEIVRSKEFGVRSKKKILIEASGGVMLDNVRQIAEAGIDIISIGYITHSAVAMDISMKIV